MLNREQWGIEVRDRDQDSRLVGMIEKAEASVRKTAPIALPKGV